MGAGHDGAANELRKRLEHQGHEVRIVDFLDCCPFGIGWFIIISLLSSDLAKLDNGLDIWMRLLQLILILAIVGTIAAIYNAYVVAAAEGQRWYWAVWAILIALSAAFLVWLCLDLGLLTASLNY